MTPREVWPDIDAYEPSSYKSQTDYLADLEERAEGDDE